MEKSRGTPCAAGEPSSYYPVFLTIEGRTCLVVGAGAVAERKIRTLLKCGAKIRLVARELSAWLEEKRSEKVLTWAGEGYERSHLQGVSLVFAATSDPDLNRSVAADALDLGILCNMATEPDLGSFIVPSVFERGALRIAISTSGLSPAVAKLLREKLELEIGPEWDFFVRLLGELRERFRSEGISQKEGEKIFSSLARLPIPGLLRDGCPQKAFEETLEVCSRVMAGAEIKALWEGLWNLFSL
ncbi:MAG TPA: bifunctional precorrin-2 dehydrogenase/sirohydrochlorin ferrochelatase [Syntrophobacteraceae bacterium]|nr:bifunctional precorrin-2 dehydrogenase/sirohydrochlorin ferrochelatase [Syntrophobacteraceae bacterium]